MEGGAETRIPAPTTERASTVLVTTASTATAHLSFGRLGRSLLHGLTEPRLLRRGTLRVITPRRASWGQGCAATFGSGRSDAAVQAMGPPSRPSIAATTCSGGVVAALVAIVCLGINRGDGRGGSTNRERGIARFCGGPWAGGFTSLSATGDAFGTAALSGSVFSSLSFTVVGGTASYACCISCGATITGDASPTRIFIAPMPNFFCFPAISSVAAEGIYVHLHRATGRSIRSEVANLANVRSAIFRASSCTVARRGSSRSVCTVGVDAFPADVCPRLALAGRISAGPRTLPILVSAVSLSTDALSTSSATATDALIGTKVAEGAHVDTNTCITWKDFY